MRSYSDILRNNAGASWDVLRLKKLTLTKYCDDCECQTPHVYDSKYDEILCDICGWLTIRNASRNPWGWIE